MLGYALQLLVISIWLGFTNGEETYILYATYQGSHLLPAAPIHGISMHALYQPPHGFFLVFVLG
jgi:hypothetical protein